MAENQERADGWSGQRSTTVCRVSGECSSSCLKEEIRKLLTSLLSLDGCWDFYSKQPLMNKFLLNIENTLPALSGRPSSAEFNLNLWVLKLNVIPLLGGFQLRQMLISLIHLESGAQDDKVKCVETRVDSSRRKTRKKHFCCVLGGPCDTMPSPTKFP